MADEFEVFIEQQKRRLARERDDLSSYPPNNQQYSTFPKDSPNFESSRKKWDVDSARNQAFSIAERVDSPDVQSTSVLSIGEHKEGRQRALQLKEDRRREYNELISKANKAVFKENVPPKPDTPEAGLISKLGGAYEEKRQRLQAERKEEYNRLLVEKQKKKGVVEPQQSSTYQRKSSFDESPPKSFSREPHKSSMRDIQGEADVRHNDRDYEEYLRLKNEMNLRSRANSHGNLSKRDPEYEQWMDQPPAPRKGWGTPGPSYEELLDRKRKEERDYRRFADPDSYDGQFGSAYNKISISDGNINQSNIEDDRRNRMEREYDSKRVRFGSDARRDDSNPNNMMRNVAGQSRRIDPYEEKQPRRVDPYDHQPNDYVPNSRSSDNQRRINSGEEDKAFLIGKVETMTEAQRRKETYRLELEQQMAEARARKQRDKIESRAPGGETLPKQNSVDKRFTENNMDRQSRNPQMERVSRRSEPRLQMQPYPPENDTSPYSQDNYRHPNAAYDNRSALKGGSILSSGFDFDLYRPSYPPISMPYTAPSSNLTSNGPPAMRSPLDDAYHYYGQQNPMDPSLAAGSLAGYPLFQMPPSAPSYPMDRNDQSTQYRPTLSQHSSAPNIPGYQPGGAPDTDRNVVVDKKLQYQRELQKQIQEGNLKKQRQLEENERYDKKIEEDCAKFSVIGVTGGGGAPLRDQFGNIVTTRRPRPLGQPSQIDTSTPRSNVQSTPPQAYPVDDAGWQTSPPTDVRTTNIARPSYPVDNNDITTHARGGHGIFGQPMSEEQRDGKSRYQDDLRKQIEEKKIREQIEKEKLLEEERKMMKKIEEDNLRIKMEQEEEKRKANEEKKMQEEKREEEKREAEKRKREKEAQEAARQKEEEARDAARRKEDEAREAARRKEEEAREAARRREEEMRARRKEEDMMRANQLEREAYRSPPENVNTNVNSTSRIDYSAREPPPASPPVPAKRSQSRQSVAPNAEVLNQLAKMKHQLQTERRRVESALKQQREAGASDDQDAPMPQKSRQTRPQEPETYEMPFNKGPVLARRGGTADQSKNPRTSNRTTQTSKKVSYPDEETEWNLALNVAVEEHDRERQSNKKEVHDRRSNKRQSSNVSRHNSELYMKSPNALESKTTFLEFPNSRTDNYPFPDDFEDMQSDPSRNRRHRQMESPVKEPKSYDRPGSVISLDPEELGRKNDERLRKLNLLSGDSISMADPDDILQRFMTKQKHDRPPSGHSLMDDSWIRAGSGH